MRAIVVTEHGPPSSLKVSDDVPRPERAKGEALIRVVGAGVNPVDTKIRRGKDGGGLDAKLPKILGGDLSGVVVEIDDVDDGGKPSPFKRGDFVIALTDGFHWYKQREGCYAQYASVPVSSLAAAPKSMENSLVDAAAIPLVALTAWQTLALAPDDAIKGKRVLVHAGAGGVGHVAAQLSKAARGASFVAATGRPHSFEFLKSLGVDEVIDYSEENWDDKFLKKDGDDESKIEARKFDVVFDLISGDAELKSYNLMKSRGSYYLHVFNTQTDAALSEKTKEEWAKDGSGRQYHGPTLVVPDGAALSEIAKLVDEGKLKVFVSKVLPLEKASEAHEELEKLSVRGKIVLKVSEEE